MLNMETSKESAYKKQNTENKYTKTNVIFSGM